MRASGSAARMPWLGHAVAAGLLGALLWIGGRELIEIVQSGWLPGRKGPGLSAGDHPIAFWAMIAFIGAGLACCAGVATICAFSAVRALLGRERSH
ncbi:hypothetical protein D3C80_1194130 [compost metagenome]